jgi:hypothetical protein
MIFSFEAVIPADSGYKTEVVATLDTKDLKYPVGVDDIPIFPIVSHDKEAKHTVLCPYLRTSERLLGVRVVLQTERDTRSMYTTFTMDLNHHVTTDILRQMLATNVNLLWDSNM